MATLKEHVTQLTHQQQSEDERPCVPLMPLTQLQIYDGLPDRVGKHIHFAKLAFTYRTVSKALKHQHHAYAPNAPLPWSPPVGASLDGLFAAAERTTSAGLLAASMQANPIAETCGWLEALHGNRSSDF